MGELLDNNLSDEELYYEFLYGSFSLTRMLSMYDGRAEIAQYEKDMARKMVKFFRGLD
tara:strand:+ start:532 stop:705 length:174 start_codon:yes stop_codon:yes gene_type:complete